MNIRKLLFSLVLFLGVILLSVLLWRECTAPKPPAESSIHHMIVERVEELGKLELVKYKIKDVVEQSIERSWWEGGDTKVLVIVSGEAVGCIDLRKIREEDLVTNDSTITLYMPEPELCYVKVNHEQSKLYYAPTSPFNESGLP